MDIGWLEDFLTLAELRNFSRAAQRRNITQLADNTLSLLLLLAEVAQDVLHALTADSHAVRYAPSPIRNPPVR